jgi:hypothetical protein
MHEDNYFFKLSRKYTSKAMMLKKKPKMMAMIGL